MTVNVRIPTILRSYTGGAAEVTVAEGTLRDVIAGLDASYPGLVRFAQGLDTHVAAGTRVSVIPAVAGGAAGLRPT